MTDEYRSDWADLARRKWADYQRLVQRYEAGDASVSIAMNLREAALAKLVPDLAAEIENLREHRCTSRIAEERGAVLRCFLWRGHSVPLSSLGAGLHLAGGVKWADDDDRVLVDVVEQSLSGGDAA